MITFFRRFFSSRIGVIAALAFVLLLMFAFAAGDIAGLGGISSGSRDGEVAEAGDKSISSSELSQAATNTLENFKRQDPRLSMKVFIADGGLERVLDEVLSRTALSVFGKQNGILASDRLIDSEIATIPAFRGPDGKFSSAAFQQALRQQGLNETDIRDDLAQGLIARQILTPAEMGAVEPRDFVARYAALLREHRTGSIALLPSAAFAPKAPPSDADLQAFYAKNRNNFILPERRIIRYATFGESALKAVPAPTEADIAARYNADKAKYAASEARRLTQLIVPTEAAGKAILDEVAKGTALDAAARTKGLSAAAVGPLDKAALAGQSSPEVAAAAFAAPSGKFAALARSGLGWHVIRVDGIDKRPERSLAQVRSELTGLIATEKRRAALNDLTARIEEEFENGGNLTDAAKELTLTPQQTPLLTADGQVFGQPGQTAPPVLARLIQTAFAMERDGPPQLAEIEAGKTFVVFDVTKIEPSAPPALAMIRNDVVTAWMLEKGSAAAKAATDRVLAEVRKGGDLGAAMATLGMSLPPVDRVDLGREQLAQYKQAVPPPLRLLFSMAKGTVKPLQAPNNRGWYVVALKNIVPGAISPDDPQLVGARKELGQLAGREYAEQLAKAIRAEVGVKRNEAAIKALRNQLSGNN